jgi:hypothetical protein
MSDEKAHSISLPLLGTYARVSDALAQAQAKRREAVVSTDGTHFWLHPLSELQDLAASRQKETLLAFQEHRLPVLGRGPKRDVKLQPMELTQKTIERAFDAVKADAIVTSVFHDVEGDWTITAIIRPGGMFKLVRKVWRCPVDNEKFDSSGICKTHGCDLVNP